MEVDEWYEEKEKERALQPHYMFAKKPQADTTYVDVRTHITNKSNRGAEKQGEARGKERFP